VNLTSALASFDDVYSPRIVTRMNDYDVRIAHARGEHVWHVHGDTDEFFLVLDGRFDVSLRGADGRETTVELSQGDVFVVPKGTEHKPSSPGGSILMFEPSGNVDDRRPPRGGDPGPRGQHHGPRAHNVNSPPRYASTGSAGSGAPLASMTSAAYASASSRGS
jgi:mannose-6-phosphate isomerase-like protein (cupin superfamily)